MAGQGAVEVRRSGARTLSSKLLKRHIESTEKGGRNGTIERIEVTRGGRCVPTCMCSYYPPPPPPL